MRILASSGRLISGYIYLTLQKSVGRLVRAVRLRMN